MNTEIMAVSFLKLAIAKTAYLVPHINEGDREPSWDGDIEVYSRPGAHHSKADLVQKVPIQVKGRSVVKISQKKTTSFPIDISDLQNFLTAGGTIFFVIDVDKTGDHAQIYYSCLLPYELRKILAKYGKQKTRNMPLVAFPKESDSIANVLLNCAQDIKKQRTAITADMVTLETLVQAGSVPELSFGYIQVPSDNSVPFEYLFDHDTYLYATLPFGVVLPIDKMGQIDVAYTEIEAPVSIDGQLFYDRYRIAYKRDCYELCFGKSTKLVHYYKPEQEKLSFTLSGTLTERIADESFIIAALTSGGFDVASVKVSLQQIPSEQLQQFNISRRQEHIEWLKCVKETLHKLSVSVDLDCNNLSNTDEGRLHMLKSSVLDGKPITLEEVPNHLCHFAIGNLSIIAYLKEVDGKNKQYQIFDFNHAPTKVSAEDRDGKLVPSSLYVILKRDALLEYSNIDYQAMLTQMKSVPFSEVFSSQATNLLLEMLDAYDKSNGKRKDIIAAAVELAEWLRKEDTFCTEDLRIINHLQAIRRTRVLSLEESHQLIELVENGKCMEERVYVGAYLLLDQQDAAQLHFMRMTEEEKKQVLQYPIGLFMRSSGQTET